MAGAQRQPQGAAPTAGETAAIALPVEICQTEDASARNRLVAAGHLPFRGGVPGVVGQLSYDSDGLMAVLVPQGWFCHASIGIDGSQMVVGYQDVRRLCG